MVVATKIDLPLQSSVFLADGVVGMGLPGSSSLGVDTWFAQIMAHGGPFFGEKVFGMVLSPHGTGPKFVFGGRDTNKFVGDLNYTGVTKNAVRILQGVLCLRLTPTHYNITDFLGDQAGFCHSQRKRH